LGPFGSGKVLAAAGHIRVVEDQSEELFEQVMD
jgi:hypothetical protein